MQNFWALPTLLLVISAQAQPPLIVEHGIYDVHLLLHRIGTEEYSIADTGGENRVLDIHTSLNDRGTQRSSLTSLTFAAHFEPLRLEQSTPTAAADIPSLTEISGKSVTIDEAGTLRTLTRPEIAFPGFTANPAALQMMMMRYWHYHHEPKSLTILRASPQALPLEIKLVGHEAFQIDGQMVRLTRYTVANLVFGREILWMNDSFRVAAVMTFAGGFPQEEVLDEYDSATTNLFRSGIRQQMLDLAAIDAQVPPEAFGSYAIVGARLIDGTGAAPIENATVVIQGGRITSAGTKPAPAGMKVIHAEGKSLLPGLWEMHSHYSGVEFGPALLSAGVTTARDCGGELDFLLTIRDAIAKDHVLGPRLLLAGLIDSGGPLGFGLVDAETPSEGIAAVDLYAALHFQQIKVYTQLKPGVLRAVAAEAHRLGLTITGHVPAAITTQQGIDDGMDQINHLQYVTRALRAEGDAGPIDFTSDPAKSLIALLKERNIVVDPTDSWSEMAGHPKNVDPATFEPGILAAPFTLASKYRNLGVPASGAPAFAARMKLNAEVIRALYQAGVPIVAGSDTGLIGYGLDRELELYVQAGMTPIAAIQTATLNAARAMHLEADSGTVEPGKRADLILVEGNPYTDIGDIRRVVKVVTEGRMYDSKKLGRSVGFNR